MKILIWLCVFLSIPLLAFTAAKQPSSISVIKETGKALSATGMILLFVTLLRFSAKRYLRSNHSKQHSFLRNTSQKILHHHSFFAITALLLLVGHGVALTLTATYWTPRMLLGSITIFMFFFTSLFGYLITKKRQQRQSFYNLHIICLLLALSTLLLHIKYKAFSGLL